MAHPAQGRHEWRELVLRFHAPGMNEGTRVLLMVMSEHMDSRRYVSVPRSKLAEILDVAPARITERILVAKELGLLDVVQAGRPRVTATYQGLFPRGTHVRTKSRRQNALGRGTGLRTSEPASGGTHVPDASSKRSSPEAPALSSADEDLEEASDSGLALAPTALGRAAAEDTRVRTTTVDRAEDERVRTPQATSHINNSKPIPLPDDWTPNAQHRVMMTNRGMDHVETIEAFEGTWQAYHERRRNWDTTFARFIIDFDEDGALHWGVA